MISNTVEYRNKDRIADIGRTQKPDSVFSIPAANANKSTDERSRGSRSYSQYFGNNPFYRYSFVGVKIKSSNISPDYITDYIEDTVKEDLEFISTLKETDNIDDLKAIDELYEYVDKLLDYDDFPRIVNLIEAVTKKSFSLRVLVGFLTITHSQKNRIANRHKLIQAAKQRAEQKGLTVTQINSILKGF